MFLPSDITLQFGDSGDFVAEMQRRLVAVQGGSGNLVTGHFDGMTVNAVSAFQSRVGLRADGIAGPDTLRRLNGVYSGEPITASDSSTSSANAEEEEAARAAQFQRDAFIAADAQALSAAAAPFVADAAAQERYAENAAVATTTLYEPRAPEPLPPALDLQQQQQAQIQRDTALLQQAQAAPHVPLTDIQHHHSLAPIQHDAVLLQQTQAAPQVPPIEIHHQQQVASQPAPNGSEPATQQVTAAPHNGLAESRETTVLTREQAPTLVQRGLQMANAVMQRLASYFEEKLPDSVLKQVQDAGRVMAQSGVKEVAIPTGPELPARGPELPTRGPEQSQAAQRG